LESIRLGESVLPLLEKGAQLTQADENVERLKPRVTLRSKRVTEAETQKAMTTTTARAALKQAREARRLDADRYVLGVSLASEDWRAKAGELRLRPICCAPI
jgi:hypothetical protein